MSHRYFMGLLAACALAACKQLTGTTQPDEGKVIAPEASHALPAKSNWSGFYQTKSRLCTSPISGNSCSDEFQDCLRIEPGPNGYLVELNSIQAYQHVCAFRFEMKELNGELVFDSPLGQLTLRRVSNNLVITSNGIDPAAGGLGICGAHADIDALTFPLTAKTESSAQCFQGGP